MVSSIDSYSLLKIIGQGSFGEVWLVEEKGNEHKKFVLKKINLVRASSKECEAARQECLILRSLEHPNIVQYKASFEENNSLYIAMAFCEDGDLYTNLEERGGIFFPEKQIVEWLIQITMALSYIHERNILHRDLKTQNVFLTKSIIKIGDLGIAKRLKSKNDMAKTFIGTPYYMSPELFEKKPYNFKSDIWSLGCVTYEMATLKHAFNAKNYTALSYKILNGQTPDMPSRYNKELIILIQDMLNKSPERRPSTTRILCNPFIRQHIQVFVENSKGKSEKRRKHSKDNQHDRRKLSLSDEKPCINISPIKSDQQKHNENVVDESTVENHNQQEHNDNDDVVIVHSSNDSHSINIQEKNQRNSRKSSKTDLEKGVFDATLKNHNQQEHDDNNDVVVVHSSNDSHSINIQEKNQRNSRKSKKTDLEKGIFDATLNNYNQQEHNDNDDGVITNSSNDSQKSSSINSQKENYRDSRKSSTSDLERKLQKSLSDEKIEVSILSAEIDNESLNKSKNLNAEKPKIEYEEISKESSIVISNEEKRAKRRQNKRSQGFQTLKFPNSNENCDIEKCDAGDNEINENNRDPRRRRKNNSNNQDGKTFKLPELMRVECKEDKNKDKCPDVLQVVEKMNETLNIKGKFENMKDSILVYKAQKEPAIYEPIEDEQETLDRSKYLNKRYPEIRKEIMANVGYKNLNKCYEVLQNLDHDHEKELMDILNDDYERFCGKIIWLKMIEDN